MAKANTFTIRSISFSLEENERLEARVGGEENTERGAKYILPAPPPLKPGGPVPSHLAQEEAASKHLPQGKCLRGSLSVFITIVLARRQLCLHFPSGT